MTMLRLPGALLLLVLVVGSIVYFKLFDPTKEVEVGR